jgi:hypothetical protein
MAWKRGGEEDQTTPFGGTIFDQIRSQSELSYGFSSRWNCHMRVNAGEKLSVSFANWYMSALRMLSVSDPFSSGCTLDGHKFISRSIVPEEALPVHLRLLQPLPTHSSMPSTHSSLRYRLLGALGPAC